MKEKHPNLASGSTPEFRRVEVSALVLYHLALIWLGWMLWRPLSLQPQWVWALIVFLSLVLADFVSGLVHWAGDTWGSVHWPLIGQTLIRTFREHHVDPKAITRHGFIETNASNCLVSLPVLTGCILLRTFFWDDFSLIGVSVVSTMTVWVYATNQIHKYSHMDVPPLIARALQRAHVILTPQNHDQHHRPPFDRYYCITTGWLNPILAKVRFFEILESLIEGLTGAAPRAEDLRLTQGDQPTESK